MDFDEFVLWDVVDLDDYLVGVYFCLCWFVVDGVIDVEGVVC